MTKTDTAAKVKALLLSCMDFRYPLAIINYMNEERLTRNYDHVILAGASLGAVLDYCPDLIPDCPDHIKPHWSVTFFDHLRLAVSIHQIDTVYILDHRDCGAYQKFRGLPDDVDPEVERLAHEVEMNKLKRKIQEEFIRNPLTIKGGLLQRLPKGGDEEFTVLDLGLS